jgi:low affinity Fe/Cu permease
MDERQPVNLFMQFSKWMARASGHPLTFAIALLTILVWLVTGPIFKWSDAWQLVVNTWTNIATFLMVFLIQNSQNRDTQALQLKLDEVIRVLGGAHNAMLDLEDRSQDELAAVRERYLNLAEQARTPEGERHHHDSHEAPPNHVQPSKHPADNPHEETSPPKRPSSGKPGSR